MLKKTDGSRHEAARAAEVGYASELQREELTDTRAA